jgi:uncharacterized membrane protein
MKKYVTWHTVLQALAFATQVVNVAAFPQKDQVIVAGAVGFIQLLLHQVGYNAQPPKQ